MAKTEGDVLRRAILEDPSDDGLRLIYADWLEDNGDLPQATSIRTQIAVQQLPEREGCAAGKFRRSFADSSFTSNLPVCGNCQRCSLLLQLPQPAACRFGTHGQLYEVRGFAREWMATVEAFMKYLDNMFQWYPIERVYLINRRMAAWESIPQSFVWFVSSPPWADYQLPFQILRHLAAPIRGDGARQYSSTLDGCRDLSNACVTLGRSRAKLPPLKQAGSQTVDVGSSQKQSREVY